MTISAALLSSAANPPPSRCSLYPGGDTRRRHHHHNASIISFRASLPPCDLKLVRRSDTLTEVVLVVLSPCDAGEVSFAGHHELGATVPFQEHAVFKGSVLPALIGKYYAARVERQNLSLLIGELKGISQIRVIGWDSTPTGTTQAKTTKDSLVYVAPDIAVKDTDGRAIGVVALDPRLVANTAIAGIVTKTVLKKVIEWVASIPQGNDLGPMHLFTTKFSAALVMDHIDVLKTEGYSNSETFILARGVAAMVDDFDDILTKLRALMNINKDAPINEDHAPLKAVQKWLVDGDTLRS